MNQPVFAVLASIPGREEMLTQVVTSILPQVDRLYVWLDGHDSIPGFLNDGKISVRRGQQGYPREKFAMIQQIETGIIASIDDDIGYPGDYIDKLVDGLTRFKGAAICGFHGYLFGETPDFLDVRGMLPYFAALEQDTFVHAIGSGIAGWDSRYCRIEAQHFPHPAGADSQLAVLGQKRKWPFIALKHQAGWLSPLWSQGGDGVRRAGEFSIWQHTKKDTSSPLNARAANEWALGQISDWILHTPDNGQPEEAVTPLRGASTAAGGEILFGEACVKHRK